MRISFDFDPSEEQLAQRDNFPQNWGVHDPGHLTILRDLNDPKNLGPLRGAQSFNWGRLRDSVNPLKW